MNIRPLYDQVIVRFPDETENTTQSGIVIASPRQQTNYREAKVIAVGTGHLTTDGHLRTLTVKVGDTILSEDQGIELKHEGETYHVLRERDILGIIG